MFDEDFIIENRDYAAPNQVEQEFFALTKLAVLDPGFKFPDSASTGAK